MSSRSGAASNSSAKGSVAAAVGTNTLNVAMPLTPPTASAATTSFLLATPGLFTHLIENATSDVIKCGIFSGAAKTSESGIVATREKNTLHKQPHTAGSNNPHKNNSINNKAKNSPSPQQRGDRRAGKGAASSSSSRSASSSSSSYSSAPLPPVSKDLDTTSTTFGSSIATNNKQTKQRQIVVPKKASSSFKKPSALTDSLPPPPRTTAASLLLPSSSAISNADGTTANANSTTTRAHHNATTAKRGTTYNYSKFSSGARISTPGGDDGEEEEEEGATTTTTVVAASTRTITSTKPKFRRTPQEYSSSSSSNEEMDGGSDSDDNGVNDRKIGFSSNYTTNNANGGGERFSSSQHPYHYDYAKHSKIQKKKKKQQMASHVEGIDLSDGLVSTPTAGTLSVPSLPSNAMVSTITSTPSTTATNNRRDLAGLIWDLIYGQIGYKKDEVDRLRSDTSLAPAHDFTHTLLDEGVGGSFNPDSQRRQDFVAVAAASSLKGCNSPSSSIPCRGKLTLSGEDVVDDCSVWTNKADMNLVRHELTEYLKALTALREENVKRTERRFQTKSFVDDKRHDALKAREAQLLVTSKRVAEKFHRISLSGRGLRYVGEGIRLFKNVEQLAISDNDIKHLPFLPDNLKVLWANGNQLESILDPAFAPPSLTLTTSSKQMMASSSHSYNNTTTTNGGGAGGFIPPPSLPPTAPLLRLAENLVFVSVSGNRLTHLNFVQLMPRLCVLDASFNCITNLEDATEPIAEGGGPTGANSLCPMLSELTLSGNPVSLLPQYRLTFAVNAPQIKVLDGLPLLLANDTTMSTSTNRSKAQPLSPSPPRRNREDSAGTASAATSTTTTEVPPFVDVITDRCQRSAAANKYSKSGGIAGLVSSTSGASFSLFSSFALPSPVGASPSSSSQQQSSRAQKGASQHQQQSTSSSGVNSSGGNAGAAASGGVGLASGSDSYTFLAASHSLNTAMSSLVANALSAPATKDPLSSLTGLFSNPRYTPSQLEQLYSAPASADDLVLKICLTRIAGARSLALASYVPPTPFLQQNDGMGMGSSGGAASAGAAMLSLSSFMNPLNVTSGGGGSGSIANNSFANAAASVTIGLRTASNTALNTHSGGGKPAAGGGGGGGGGGRSGSPQSAASATANANNNNNSSPQAFGNSNANTNNNTNSGVLMVGGGSVGNSSSMPPYSSSSLIIGGIDVSKLFGDSNASTGGGGGGGMDFSTASAVTSLASELAMRPLPKPSFSLVGVSPHFRSSFGAGETSGEGPIILRSDGGGGGLCSPAAAPQFQLAQATGGSQMVMTTAAGAVADRGPASQGGVLKSGRGSTAAPPLPPLASSADDEEEYDEARELSEHHQSYSSGSNKGTKKDGFSAHTNGSDAVAVAASGVSLGRPSPESVTVLLRDAETIPTAFELPSSGIPTSFPLAAGAGGSAPATASGPSSSAPSPSRGATKGSKGSGATGNTNTANAALSSLSSNAGPSSQQTGSALLSNPTASTQNVAPVMSSSSVVTSAQAFAAHTWGPLVHASQNVAGFSNGTVAVAPSAAGTPRSFGYVPMGMDPARLAAATLAAGLRPSGDAVGSDHHLQHSSIGGVGVSGDIHDDGSETTLLDLMHTIRIRPDELHPDTASTLLYPLEIVVTLNNHLAYGSQRDLTWAEAKSYAVGVGHRPSQLIATARPSLSASHKHSNTAAPPLSASIVTADMFASFFPQQQTSSSSSPASAAASDANRTALRFLPSPPPAIEVVGSFLIDLSMLVDPILFSGVGLGRRAGGDGGNGDDETGTEDTVGGGVPLSGLSPSNSVSLSALPPRGGGNASSSPALGSTQGGGAGSKNNQAPPPPPPLPMPLVAAFVNQKAVDGLAAVVEHGTHKQLALAERMLKKGLGGEDDGMVVGGGGGGTDNSNSFSAGIRYDNDNNTTNSSSHANRSNIDGKASGSSSGFNKKTGSIASSEKGGLVLSPQRNEEDVTRRRLLSHATRVVSLDNVKMVIDPLFIARTEQRIRDLQSTLEALRQVDKRQRAVMEELAAAVAASSNPLTMGGGDNNSGAGSRAEKAPSRSGAGSRGGATGGGGLQRRSSISPSLALQQQQHAAAAAAAAASANASAGAYGGIPMISVNQASLSPAHKALYDAQEEAGRRRAFTAEIARWILAESRRLAMVGQIKVNLSGHIILNPPMIPQVTETELVSMPLQHQQPLHGGGGGAEATQGGPSALGPFLAANAGAALFASADVSNVLAAVGEASAYPHVGAGVSASGTTAGAGGMAGGYGSPAGGDRRPPKAAR